MNAVFCLHDSLGLVFFGMIKCKGVCYYKTCDVCSTHKIFIHRAITCYICRENEALINVACLRRFSQVFLKLQLLRVVQNTISFMRGKLGGLIVNQKETRI
jgi:hypothetical protein